MAKKGKYYVVWAGIEPGVYDNWDDCREQVENFPGARYKAFPTYTAAVEAYREQSGEKAVLVNLLKGAPVTLNYDAFPEIDPQGLAVDAACSRNPGPVEYRGVNLANGREVFRVGPLQGGTNNIGEYLALVHALALCAQRGQPSRVIYSDSRTAMSWLRARRANTKLQPNGRNTQVMELLRRADAWVGSHPLTNPVRKWNTEQWGEIPADFGRK